MQKLYHLSDRDVAVLDLEYNENALILNFESEESFKQFMNSISKESIENLKENSKLKNFYSLRDYNHDLNMSELKSLRISDSDKEELVPDSDDAIVYDPYFASILNENREVSIEGLRVRIIEEGVIISKNENLSDALKFVSRVKSGNIKIDEEVINTDNVTFFPEYYLNPDKKDVAKSRISATSCPYNGGGLFGHNHECFQEYGGGTFRTKGRVWSQSFAVYASMGHETKHQRKRLGLWFGRDAEYIESKINTFEVEFEEPNGSITIVDVAQVPPYNFNSTNNHDRISRTFDFQTAVFTTKPPFIYKLAKARKLKKYNTNYKTVK